MVLGIRLAQTEVILFFLPLPLFVVAAAGDIQEQVAQVAQVVLVVVVAVTMVVAVLELVVRVILAVQVLFQGILLKAAVAAVLVPLEAMGMQLGVGVAMVALELHRLLLAQALHMLVAAVAVHFLLGLLLAMVALAVAVRAVLPLAQQAARAHLLQRMERQTQAVVAAVMGAILAVQVELAGLVL